MYIYYIPINVLALKLWVDFIWLRKSESESRLKFKSGELHKHFFCNEMRNLEDHERDLLMGKKYIRNVQIAKDWDRSQSKAVWYFWIWRSTQDQILGWWGWTLRHWKKPANYTKAKVVGPVASFCSGEISLDKMFPWSKPFCNFVFGDFSLVKAWKQKSCVKLQPSLKPKTPCFFNIQSAKTMHITIIGIRMYIYHYCVWQLYMFSHCKNDVSWVFLLRFPPEPCSSAHNVHSRRFSVGKEECLGRYSGNFTELQNYQGHDTNRALFWHKNVLLNQSDACLTCLPDLAILIMILSFSVCLENLIRFFLFVIGLSSTSISHMLHCYTF